MTLNIDNGGGGHGHQPILYLMTLLLAMNGSRPQVWILVSCQTKIISFL